MPLLNIGLSALVIELNILEYKWLMTEVISGAIPMNTVRSEITEYDLEIPKSIEAPQRKLIGLQ